MPNGIKRSKCGFFTGERTKPAMINRYKPEGTRIGTQKNREYIASREGLEQALGAQAILEATAILCKPVI